LWVWKGWRAVFFRGGGVLRVCVRVFVCVCIDFAWEGRTVGWVA